MPRRKFQKGQSGNPKGRPRGVVEKVPRTFRRIALQFCEENADDILGALKKAIKEPGERIRALAVVASVEKQQVEHSAPKGGGTFVLVANGDTTTLSTGAGG
jgi:hypothetical protein